MLSILNQYPLLREKIIKQHHVRSLLLLLLYHCSIHIIKNKITFWHFLLAFYEQAMTLIYYLVTSSNNVMWIPRYLEDLTFLTIFCLLCILFYFKNWRLYSIVLFNPDLFFLKLRLFHSFYFFIKAWVRYCLIFLHEIFYIALIFYRHSLCLHWTKQYIYFYCLLWSPKLIILSHEIL